MAEPARRLDDPYDPEDPDRAGDIKPSRPDSRSLSGVPTDGVRRGGSHLGNLKAVPDNSKSLSPEELGGAEAAASSGGTSSSSAQETQSIRSNNQTFGYREEGKHKTKDKSRFSIGGLAKRKGWLIGGAAIGGLVIALVIAFLFFSSLLVPGLAQHIAEWQFARVTQQFSKSIQRVSDESLAIEAQAGDKTVYDQMVQRFSSTKAGAKASELWSQLDNYRPSKVIENLGGNNQGVKFNEATTSWGKTYLQSVELNGEEYQIARQGFSRFIPGLGSLIKFKNNVQFSQEFAPAFVGALKSDNIGSVVRSATAKQIRQELGISLVAWIVGKYSGKDPTEARLQQAKDTQAAVDEGNAPDNAVTDTIKNADQAATEAEQQCVSNDQCLQEAINNGGIIQSVKDAVTSNLSSSGIKDVVGVLNPAYGAAMPLCIVYDGSLDHSGPTINNQTAQQQRSFYYIESAADQQKYGSPKVDTEAIGAFNNDVNPNGQILQSNPEVRADGGTVDTSSVPSAEASASGEYTLLNATPGISSFAGIINGVADKACPVLTNLVTASITGVIALGLGFLTGGGDEVAGNTVAQTLKVVAQQVTDKFAERIAEEGLVQGTVKVGLGYYGRRFAGLLWDLGKTTTKQAAAIAGTTLLAKLIVMNRASQFNSGVAQANDLVNNGDAGGNVAANEISRQGTYGRALTVQEVDQSHVDTSAYVAYQNSQRSAYQRYFALDNADSLLSKIGASIYGFVYGKPLFASIFSSIGKVFSPTTLASGLFSSTSNKTAMAAASSDTQDYGNVQFGWSDAEEKLIDSNQSYSPLENQLILDQTNCDPGGCSSTPNGDGSADNYITSTYGKCFTESLGDLLQSGDVTRDSDGNVIPNQGLCAPDNLGPNNPKLGDMVFRWRIAHFTDNTSAQVTQEQGLASPS